MYCRYKHYITDPTVTTAYIYNTIMDCQAAKRLIRINNYFLTQDFDGIVGSSCKFLFLGSGLLHEVCDKFVGRYVLITFAPRPHRIIN